MHAALVTALLGLSVAAERPTVEARPPAPAPPLRPSFFGARVIEQGRVLYGLSAWYAVTSSRPGLRPMLAVGLGAGFDLAIALDVTLPPLPERETMEALELTARKGLPELGPFETAVTVELIGAYFGSRESAENLAGPRHVTGLRDLNAGLGVPLTWGHGTNLAVKPFVLASFDLQPASNGPLTGAPPPWTLGWTFGLDLGNELVFSQVLGGLRVRPGVQLLLHTRQDDRTVTLLSTLAISAG